VKLPLRDAIYEYLKSERRPKKAKHIWEALAKTGREVESDNPVRSVQWALKKMAAQNDDVFSPGWGKWHVRSRYSKSQLQKLIAKGAGRGGRSAEEHVARTKAGLERAKASGKKLGARPKFTGAQIAQLKSALASGVKVKHAIKAIGMSPAMYYLYRPQIQAWNPGEPWPPMERHPLMGMGVEGPSLFNPKGPPIRLVTG